jgi:hypothetical protein
MNDLELQNLSARQTIRLKIHDIDAHFIAKVKIYNLQSNDPDKLVALKILRLNDDLIAQVKALNMADYSLREFLKERSNFSTRFDDKSDGRRFEAFRSVVEEIYGLK